MKDRVSKCCGSELFIEMCGDDEECLTRTGVLGEVYICGKCKKYCQLREVEL